VCAPSGSALPTRFRALIGGDAEGNPYLEVMRYAAVASLVAGLLLVSAMTSGNTTLVVLAVVALSWTGMIQVGGWVACALTWERAQDWSEPWQGRQAAPSSSGQLEKSLIT